MKFNIAKCMNSLSLALDFAESQYSNIHDNHSLKVCYLALQIAREMNLPLQEQKDLYTLSLLHDIGMTTAGMNFKEDNVSEFLRNHCIEGEKSIKSLLKIKNNSSVIKYHHEHYDGSGIFKKKGNEIPLLSQIIHFSHTLVTLFNLNQLEYYDRENIKTYALMNNNKLFSPHVIKTFMQLANKDSLWLDLEFKNTNDVLERISPSITCEYSWDDILKVSEVFMKIIDTKSQYTLNHTRGTSEKTAIMSSYYQIDPITQKKLKIAANFHDIGKLYISNQILDKPQKLNSYEMSEIHKHTYFTKLVLDGIPGFEDISNWASHHHEKLNGKGYPEKLTSNDLDFESRLLCIIDIYQALTERKPYRKSMPHNKAMKILYDMANQGQLDLNITISIDKVFKDILF